MYFLLVPTPYCIVHVPSYRKIKYLKTRGAAGSHVLPLILARVFVQNGKLSYWFLGYTLPAR